MKTFKLESVLNYRRILENQAQQKLAEAFEREAALIAEINREEEELRRLYSEREKCQQVGMTVHEMQLYENRISHQVQQLAALVDAVEHCREAIAACREKLCEASREKKLMEKIKEKHLQEQHRVLNRLEAKNLDELAVIFHSKD
ncbi:flagellar export protein FliJ [Desulfuromonas sp. AOP6]|uniref:flagellar export protein FliJ n=1 Tax=Desulfuromonas sp. AOP6 TaxID=1566351 RepID=UPI00126CAB55|nr:flagellar export protein FliJ [Desulfuromonas sp. AOP6]BCA79110.1 hypothetical protein AOP6_0897 [Desulfuromonas sp. AOP6]